MRHPHAIGIDIGGTKIAAALVTAEGQCSHLKRVDTPISEGPPSIVKAVIGLAAALRQEAAAEDYAVVGVGIGTAGQVDVHSGTVVYAVETMPGWTGTELGAAVQGALGLPVVVDNDVNAMAVGEMHFGAGRGFQSALYAAVGTGVGGALLLNGELWRGVNWSAGELGHILVDWDGDRLCNCGSKGHLEAYAAGPAIANTYYRQMGLREAGDLRPVVQAADAGDPAARQAIAQGAGIMGAAMAGLAAVFNPQVLILGGSVALLGDGWWGPFEAAVRANQMPAAQKVILKQAERGHEAALIGAARLLWEHVSG
jgi:glucokinase